MKRQWTWGDGLFQTANYAALFLFMVMCVYPFYYMFIYSLSSSNEVIHGIYFWPKGFTLQNYTSMLGLPDIGQGFLVSAGRTVLGTLLTVFATSLFAYVVTKPETPLRKAFYRFTIITMYLNAGIIPWYVTMKFYGLQNNFLLYVVPTAVNAFFLILIKTYIESIPREIEDSGKVDGAGLFRMYFSVIIPLSTPILATVAIFNAVAQWNAFIDNYFLVTDSKLQTLQMILLRYLQETEVLSRLSNETITGGSNRFTISPMTVRMTITMIVTIPIMLVYPFLQRYFVKGIMLGAVKG